MRSITNPVFKTLAGHRAEWCVSLYMPADPARLQIRKDTTRLKNLLADAEKRLLARGMRSPDVRRLLEPAEALGSDSEFWRTQAGGLALFLAPDRFEHYELDVRFEEYLVVADRFHLKPLIPVFGRDGTFYLLALSQNEVRLLKGRGETFEEIELKNVPQSLEEALAYEEGGKQLQHHVVPRTRGGGGQAIYHGHGSMYPDEKENIQYFFRKLDAGVNEVLKKKNRPLMLAGVDYMRALYEQVSQYPTLFPEGINGSPDGVPLRSLFERAREMVRSYFGAAEREALEKFMRQQHSSKASARIETIIPAACNGQVDTLLLAENASAWGKYDPDQYTVFLHDTREADSDDLLDFAAVCTVVNGGDVFLLPPEELPDGLETAALFYYEVEPLEH